METISNINKPTTTTESEGENKARRKASKYIAEGRWGPGWGWGPHGERARWREGKSLVGVVQGRAGETPSFREFF